MNAEQLAGYIAFLESIDGPTPALLSLIARKRRELDSLNPTEPI